MKMPLAVIPVLYQGVINLLQLKNFFTLWRGNAPNSFIFFNMIYWIFGILLVKLNEHMRPKINKNEPHSLKSCR